VLCKDGLIQQNLSTEFVEHPPPPEQISWVRHSREGKIFGFVSDVGKATMGEIEGAEIT